MSEKPCCALAAKLGAERTEKLDEELLRPGHRSFHKLGVELQTNHMAVKRHKQKCLGLGRPARQEEPAEAPPPDWNSAGTVEQRSSDVPDEEGGTEGGSPSEPEDDAPRARARESANPPGTREDRILAIVARIGDGKLVPADVPRWAEQWGLHEGTVRVYVRQAYQHGRVDRGTVEERRILAMGMWETQIGLCDDALKKKAMTPMDRALLLKERASAITGWCKAAGVFDDSTKVNVNISGNPVFQAVTEALFGALVSFPEAHAAARAALAQRLDMLRQAPLELPAAAPVVIEQKAGG